MFIAQYSCTVAHAYNTQNFQRLVIYVPGLSLLAEDEALDLGLVSGLVGERGRKRGRQGGRRERDASYKTMSQDTHTAHHRNTVVLPTG